MLMTTGLRWQGWGQLMVGFRSDSNFGWPLLTLTSCRPQTNCIAHVEMTIWFCYNNCGTKQDIIKSDYAVDLLGAHCWGYISWHYGSWVSAISTRIRLSMACSINRMQHEQPPIPWTFKFSPAFHCHVKQPASTNICRASTTSHHRTVATHTLLLSSAPGDQHMT